MSWAFWIDRGGTFTDAIGVAPDGSLHVTKRLSSDDAPAEAVAAILARAGAEADGAALALRIGTTLATNALLERRGEPCLLIANRGLGDLLEIGTQERPELFALAIRRPPPLHAAVLELAGRSGADGALLEPLDEADARARLAAARAAGLRSAAVVWIHSYADPAPEARLAELAREAGFAYVAASAEVARELGLLARGETAVADAYLTPLLRSHAAALARALPGARLRFMQSSGGLTDTERFRGPVALLSGPAGGAVGAARVARDEGFADAIGFDMGGTSTDVTLLQGGEPERAPESVVAGVRVRAPTLRVHTIAAGGGSLCRFDGVRLLVGPESAGAQPGPLCYGLRDLAGARLAREPALTDANAFLGRLQPDRFPLPLDLAPVAEAFARLRGELAAAGHAYGAEALAAGFLEIADERMAQAIAEVSVQRGVDPRDFALVGFGGAAGQHAAAVARRLGIRRVLLHPLAGVLSAYGIGVAELAFDAGADAGRVLLEDGRAPAATAALLARLEAEGRAALAREGAEARAVRAERALDLRYRGSDTALAIDEPADADYAAAFGAAHALRYGYERAGREIEVVAARVRVRAPEAGPAPRLPLPPSGPAPRPRRSARVWLDAAGWREVRTAGWREVRTAGWREVPVFWREDLGAGAVLRGPALVLEETGTILVPPGFGGLVSARGTLVLEDGAPGAAAADERAADDPVRLEVAGSRFMSIAEQMGGVLRHTSVSTNMKDRLDYSCAVFDREGGLVANAPHIPVHLGAMGETVRALCAAFPEPEPGDVWVTNDPFAGGSHLPDVTVVTPVFAAAAARPDFFVASRGHHADLGGKTPGSMPADSRSLAEEGVLLPPQHLVRAGRLCEAALRAQLVAGPFPARSPDDNLADLEAMVAANRAGARLLEGLVGEQGLAAVAASMAALQRAAASLVEREICEASTRRAPLRGPPRRRDAALRAGAGRGRAPRDRLRRQRRGVEGQPQRAARRGAGRGALRAARPRRRAHPAERRLPRARDDRGARRLAAGPAARQRRRGRQRRDLAARRRRAARRARSRGGEPGHHEQRRLRRPPLRLLRDARRRGRGRPRLRRRLLRPRAHDQHPDHRRRGARGALSGAPRGLRAPPRLRGRGPLARRRRPRARLPLREPGDGLSPRRAPAHGALRPRRGVARRGGPQPRGARRRARHRGARARHPRARRGGRALDRDPRRRRLRSAGFVSAPRAPTAHRGYIPPPVGA